MYYTKCIEPIEMQTINATKFTGVYVLGITLPSPCFLLRIINCCNQDIKVSFDGVTDNDFCLIDDTIQISVEPNINTNFKKWKKIYVSAAVGTGNVYITGYTIKKEE